MLLTFEIGLEEVGLMAHNLPMLNRFVIQQSVQLNCLVCGRTVLILCRMLPDPEVNVHQKLVRALLLVPCKKEFEFFLYH